MMKRRVLRPEVLDLEDRLAMSHAGMAMPAGAPAVFTASLRAAAAPPDRSTRIFEINFLAGMIPHHQMAINMSTLALRYGKDAEVRDLARRIISEQRPEVLHMQRFLAVDGVRGYFPGISADEQRDLGALGSQRGNAFDVAFLNMMTEHHTRAINGDGMGMVGARECLAKAQQRGVLGLCSGIISTQARELGQMGSILARLGPSQGTSGMMG